MEMRGLKIEKAGTGVTCKCSLCKKVEFLKSSQNRVKTTALCVLILKSLKELKPEKEFYSMKQDIYDFVSEHWNCVSSFSIFKRQNYKKLLLDTFNHCSCIETGRNYGLRASFRLKEKKINESVAGASSECEKNSLVEVMKEVKTEVVQCQTPTVDLGNFVQEYSKALLDVQGILYNDVALLKKYNIALAGKANANWTGQYTVMSQQAALFGGFARDVFSSLN
ncbi:hypothetical protein EIN_056570 [Entamoeba invadens IP1]|uniref:hypothetical protein n=1 Tax=Entamoeba invadens IP1 TaxID=370355 RepID=UPI0002C3DCE9|nr:hypothetical protein EIN_056570 [Entamoeba invadens IP1]ELP93282.1 hypothetical protein EIN_056570 [Entamoeba invadens IP1]|eukprot:XP_004260053.1 hypothetical protein EIN_056570 [Entamoeba invadens IP1]